jgi:hypothetical protein
MALTNVKYILKKLIIFILYFYRNSIVWYPK